MLLLVIVGYLVLLFGLASWAERHSSNRWVRHPLVYMLSLGVYCSAWTYYGSVGIAATKGMDFLPIYLGPVIALPLWVVVLRKVLQVSKQRKVASLADFLSMRYGSRRSIGALVAIICLMGTVPYLSLQLKALSESYDILMGRTRTEGMPFYTDYAFYMSILVAVFAAFYGTRRTDASEQHQGIVFTTAFESLLKLIIFMIIGAYTTYGLFDGTTDLYQRIEAHPNFEQLTSFGGVEQGFTWLFTIALSFMAIFLLPRQFQMSVVENTDERHLKTATWGFPLYLLLFNLFVVYLAWAGLLSVPGVTRSDYLTLLLPLEQGQIGLALLVFIGGLSAVLSMIVVSTLALSTMVSNNLIIPYGFLSRLNADNSTLNTRVIKTIRRLAIVTIIVVAYLFYVGLSTAPSLYSIGLISFTVIAQLGPAFFLGLYWSRGNGQGALIGSSAGLLVVLYTLILPYTLDALGTIGPLLEEGPWGIALLRPNALLGLDFLSPPAHAFFWSMLVNTALYTTISLRGSSSSRERNYAELVVDQQLVSGLGDGGLVWKGEAYVKDIKEVLYRFLGVRKAELAVAAFFDQHQLPSDTSVADARLISHAEQLLTGSIGSASAKILVANVVKEQPVSLPEVLEILEESKANLQHNKLLQQQSEELSILTQQLEKANEQLLLKDQQKDDFLDTVAHEIKSPITGIRATAEVLMDDIDELPPDLRNTFLENILQDSDRLSRLIHHLLDFEKLANGRVELHIKPYPIGQTIQHAVHSFASLAAQRQIALEYTNSPPIVVSYDEDRLLQVLTNLLSNAIKFAPPTGGVIQVRHWATDTLVYCTIEDNGPGISEADLPHLFDRFYQARQKPRQQGSGLGLAICQQIIRQHGGTIRLENRTDGGARATFTLPLEPILSP